MKAGIYTNLKKSHAKDVTLQLINVLKANSFDVCVHKSIASFYDGETFDFDDIGCDILFTLGGDGTVLRMGKFCAQKNIPILGINIGTIGFLTEIAPEDIEKAVPLIKNGDYKMEKRSLIEFDNAGKTEIALNDIVINTIKATQLMLIDLYIDGQAVDRYYCDGYIVSTPTGSTAYSLSAGGAIVSPHAEVLALTPLNSHSLHSRPLVIADDETVTIKIYNGRKINVISDGDVVASGAFEEITIKKSQKYATFIRLENRNFYNKLLDKLNKWSVADIKE